MYILLRLYCCFLIFQIHYKHYKINVTCMQNYFVCLRPLFRNKPLQVVIEQLFVRGSHPLSKGNTSTTCHLCHLQQLKIMFAEIVSVTNELKNRILLVILKIEMLVGNVAKYRRQVIQVTFSKVFNELIVSYQHISIQLDTLSDKGINHSIIHQI